MKAIRNLIITLVVIVAILGVVIIGGYIYVRTTYGIDLFRTAGQLKTLSQDVDESALCPNAYGEQDFVTMKSEIDKRFSGLIVYEKGKGYNGYSVNFDALNGKVMTDMISLTEKQVGPDEYVLSCRLEVKYLNEKYNLGIEESKEYDTLAGFIIFNYEGIPTAGETVFIGGLQLRILRTTRSRIELARVKKL